MPIYEYECRACGGHFEYMQSMKDGPKTRCERCGGALDRLISASAFHLKGTGWYKTDYAAKGEGSAARGDAKKGDAKSGDAKSGDGGSGEAKKPATAPGGDKGGAAGGAAGGASGA